MSYNYPFAANLRRIAPGVKRAYSLWDALSADIDQYVTKSFRVTSAYRAKVGLGDVQFKFYKSPTPAPAPPIVGIDLTGLATAGEILDATFAALTANGFFGVQAPNSSFRLYQELPGIVGNTEITGDASLDQLTINGGTFATGELFFYNGQSVQAPVRFGYTYGAKLTPLPTPDFVPIT